MGQIETNVFPILNLAELNSQYRRYRIKGLTSRLRKKRVSVKLPCKLSPELDEIRPKRVFKSRTLPFSW